MAVTPPPFKKINIPEVQRLALEFDRQGYAASDADFAARFPQLAAGREYLMGDIQSGGQDPLVASTLDKSGLSANYGGSNYEQARNMGAPDILSKEKRDRKYFARLLDTNKPRQFGVYNAADTTKMLEYNVGGINSYNQSTFGSRINAYNAAITQQARDNMMYANAAGSVLGDIGRFYQNSRLTPLDYGYYNLNQTGGFSGGRG